MRMNLHGVSVRMLFSGIHKSTQLIIQITKKCLPLDQSKTATVTEFVFGTDLLQSETHVGGSEGWRNTQIDYEACTDW
jgi:hypothetical protein